jgi:hypothetical protein
MAKEQQRFIDLLPKAEYLEHHLNGLGWHKVTYCKDCKWRSERGTCITWYDSPKVPNDGYCYLAERKEE